MIVGKSDKRKNSTNKGFVLLCQFTVHTTDLFPFLSTVWPVVLKILNCPRNL